MKLKVKTEEHLTIKLSLEESSGDEVTVCATTPDGSEWCVAIFTIDEGKLSFEKVGGCPTRYMHVDAGGFIASADSAFK